ncbi:MAG: pilus assembly protein PilM [Planctomycetota bacterium]
MQASKRKLGYIGVDVGTSTLKVAQVERNRQGWQVAAASIVPRRKEWDAQLGLSAKAESSRDELHATRSLHQGYRGRRVAAAIPMAVCDLHRLDRDLSREANPEAVLRQAFETATQLPAEGLLCDYWSGPATESTSEWSQALALPRDWTEQVCEDVASAGWSCDAIDGLPLALTRAVNMVHAANGRKPVAALDWGSRCATLCCIENHQATYVRSLKLPGLNEVLEVLVDSLQVSELEAQSLLEQHGILGRSDSGANDVSELIKEVIAEMISSLEAELKRSFSHFQFLRRAQAPSHLYLMGGGAMISGLDQHLAKRLELDARNWRLPNIDNRNLPIDERADCLFATAIALSALAWEVS